MGASVLGDFFSEIVLPTPAAIKINGIRITASGGEGGRQVTLAEKQHCDSEAVVKTCYIQHGSLSFEVSFARACPAWPH